MSGKVVTIRGRQVDLDLQRDGTSFFRGQSRIEVILFDKNEARIEIDGKTFLVPFTVDGTKVSFLFDGEIYSADVADKGGRAKARHRDHSMAAPMPGLVLKILVRPGDVVTRGAPLVVLEAMKMEHQIVAPHDGTVAAVNCQEGEMVQAGLDLVELKEAEPPVP